jgi:hypothetical protein
VHVGDVGVPLLVCSCCSSKVAGSDAALHCSCLQHGIQCQVLLLLVLCAGLRLATHSDE